MASTRTDDNIDEERLQFDFMTGTPEDSEKEEERKGPSFRDLVGMEKVVEELKMVVLVPLYNPELLRCLGVQPIQGILLHGSSGCDKTKLAHAIANETGRAFHKISARDIVSGSIGESEKNIRTLFSKANKTAPSIIFIDEIHAIASESEYPREVTDPRIVTQLMTCMDASQKTGYVLVIGATNMPNDVDPELRRPGRFDREIFIGIPNESARADILSKLTCNKKVEGSFDILKIARSTPGFVGADLDALVNKAGNLAIKRIISEKMSELLRDSVTEEEWWKQKWLPEEMEKHEIVMADFEEAVKFIQPSSRREGFSSEGFFFMPQRTLESDWMTRTPEDSGKEKEEEREGPRFRDLVGMKKVLEELKMEVLVPLYNPGLLRCLGVQPMQGILLHGLPGCDKTKLVHAIANETGRPLHKISARDIVSGSIAQPEQKIQKIFSEANITAPSIILIDEIHLIAPKRETLLEATDRRIVRESLHTNQRIVTQLMTCMDASQRTGYVLVIGATNMPDDVDPGLRRPGRFDREIFISDLDQSERADILSKLTSNKKFEGSFDIIKIAKSTSGFVEAELDELVNKAGNLAIKRIISERKSKLLRDFVNEEEWWKQKWLPKEMEKLEIVTADFEEAIKLVRLSSRREGLSSMPQAPWFRDLGGMEKLWEQLIMEVLMPLYNPELLTSLGVQPMQGILLHGPPGCGKTILAHAIANETGRPIYMISGSDITSGVPGASERKIRNLFSKANKTAPSIILIEEINAIASKRENLHHNWERTIVTQLMSCMDASMRAGYVLVIGTTNMPDDVDPALRRPGRFDREIFIGIPDESGRVDIFSKLTQNIKAEGSFDILKIAKSTPGFVGADLNALVNKAGNLAIKRIISERKPELFRDSINEEEWWKQKLLPEEMEKLAIVMADFEEATKLVQPSLRREGFSYIPNVKWVDVGGLGFLRKELI